MPSVDPASALPPGAWNPFNHQRLSELLLEHGRGATSYHPERPPYAVFDWDNTSVFLDVEEATLVYQLDRFQFHLTPEAFRDALTCGMPDDPEMLCLLGDAVVAYAWLFLRRAVGAPNETLLLSSRHREFRCKMLRLYQRLEEVHGPIVAYAWMPFRFTGMTAEEVRTLTHEAVLWQLEQPIENVTWRSAEGLDSRAGVVEARWRSGVRLLAEMQSLYANLRREGFDVWVCTASFAEGIREIASSPIFGYGLHRDNVIGLQLETDSAGRFTPVGVGELTYASGKSEALRRRLLSLYGYGPTLVAGDSDGDAAMLSDFADTSLSLVIEVGRPADSSIGSLVRQALEERGQTSARFLVQHRDESLGSFRPD